MGVFGGMFDYDEDLSAIAPGQSFSDSATAVKVYGGYRFNEWFAVEGSYGKTGDLEETVPLFAPPFGTLNAEVGANYEFLTVNALGHIAFEKMSLFAGLGYWDADISVDLTVNVPGFGQITDNETDSDDGTMLSAGLEWEFDSLAVRGELDWFDVEEADAFMVGVGVHWLFGR